MPAFTNSGASQASGGPGLHLVKPKTIIVHNHREFHLGKNGSDRENPRAAYALGRLSVGCQRRYGVHLGSGSGSVSTFRVCVCPD